MPVQIRPNGGVAIEILFALRILQHRPLAPYQDDRFRSLPIPHLRKRMPDITPIQLSEFMHQPFRFLMPPAMHPDVSVDGPR